MKRWAAEDAAAPRPRREGRGRIFGIVVLIWPGLTLWTVDRVKTSKPLAIVREIAIQSRFLTASAACRHS